MLARFGILPALRQQGRLDGTGHPSRPMVGLGLGRTFATGILPFAHSMLACFGILPALRQQGRLDGTGHPSRPFSSSAGPS
jgi:hypothetical protein